MNREFVLLLPRIINTNRRSQLTKLVISLFCLANLQLARILKLSSMPLQLVLFYSHSPLSSKLYWSYCDRSYKNGIQKVHSGIQSFMFNLVKMLRHYKVILNRLLEITQDQKQKFIIGITLLLKEANVDE